MIKSGIYKITNIINGKIYVGSSVDLGDRKYVHFNDLKKDNHPNNKLQRSYNKYGLENFKFEVIEFIEDKTNLVPREQHYLDTLLFAQEFINNKDKRFSTLGYNLCPIAGSSLGVKRSDEFKDKVSKFHKGKVVSEETKAKLSIANKGRKISESHKSKLLKSNSIPCSQEKKNKISKSNKEYFSNNVSWHKGKIISKETRELMSESANNRKKPVLQLDSITGELIKEWPSIISTSIFFKSKNIAAVCKGDRKSCAGFNWQYKV